MGVVRRDDAHTLDAVGAARFGLGHRGEVAIDPVGRDTQLVAHRAVGVGLAREGPRNQLEMVVQTRGAPVRRADAGAGASAHHAPPQRSHIRVSCDARDAR